MYTVAGQQYTGQQLLDLLRQLAAPVGSAVVWHDEYVAALPELTRTDYASTDAVLLSLGGCLVAGDSYAYKYRAQIDILARRILAGRPRFENSGTPKAYNRLNWTQQGVGDDAYLQLNNNRSPHAALLDLAATSGTWTLDCATFVQAVQLAARAVALGPAEFDRTARRPFLLKEHDSTGLTHAKLWYRTTHGGELRLRTPASDRGQTGESTVTTPDDALLLAAPPGSRVAFVNSDPRAEGTDFERENTVKLPDGTFASHPFGILTAAAMKRQLALQTVQRYGDEIDATLARAADGRHDTITPAEARTAQAALDRLLQAGDREALAAWIMAHRTWTENLLYDDLDEYLDDLLYLGEIEVYTITPETTAKRQ
ncbi:hypothetical protein ACIQBJ_13710 [Kitasatospora sp. NPDC088391]|uniref:hypothetical protein n=1 Tax=Kitasatospora sp. NPDC088391 TaxID=3364074 RepID=UPI0037FCB2C4